MLAPLAAAIAVSAAFEGGSIGKVETVAPDYLRCAVKGQADQNGRNRQANWYYFKLENLPRGEVTLELTDLVGEYNFKPGTHAVTRNTRPVFSYDDETWRHFADDRVSWDEKQVRLTLRFTPERPVMWIAHVEPYTARRLNKLLADTSPRLKRESIGRTVRGRDIPLLTIGRGTRTIWLMARQHAWETGTSFAADGAVRYLVSDDPWAVRLRQEATVKVLPMFDPDGVAEGAVRFNANGFDNNRNWDAVDPRLMPEIAAAKAAITGRIDIFLTLHNTESTDYVEGPVAAHGAVARALVERLRSLANFFDPASPRDSMRAPIDKGRATVNQQLFRERNVPAFLLELMVERHPILGRPRTARDFSEFGAGLARALIYASGAAR
jgi:hypothetical protein